MFRFLTVLFCAVSGATNAATADRDIDFIIKAQNPPVGVVFEIVDGETNALEWAIPIVNENVKKLRTAIPKIKIAVVSHGNEEFSLLSENKTQHAASHTAVQQLVKNDIPVHVCERHASWRGNSKKDFPEYVDVVEAGPAKIREYVREGYIPITIERSNEKR